MKKILTFAIVTAELLLCCCPGPTSNNDISPVTVQKKTTYLEMNLHVIEPLQLTDADKIVISISDANDTLADSMHIQSQNHQAWLSIDLPVHDSILEFNVEAFSKDGLLLGQSRGIILKSDILKGKVELDSLLLYPSIYPSIREFTKKNILGIGNIDSFTVYDSIAFSVKISPKLDSIKQAYFALNNIDSVVKEIQIEHHYDIYNESLICRFDKNDNYASSEEFVGTFR